METNPENRTRVDLRPAAAIAILSLILCGLLFPLLVTAVGQVAFPYQANGSVATLGGRDVGSLLIAQEFNQSVFFHSRNASASGVDPDISLQDAMSQVPRISAATGIPSSSIEQLVTRNTDPVGQYVGIQYVNVLSLNLQLIQDFPLVYTQYAQ